MDIVGAYILGQRRRSLELTSRVYDAYPEGEFLVYPQDTNLISYLAGMTMDIRKIAMERAKEITSPQGILGKFVFYAAYFLGVPKMVTSIKTAFGPTDPGTGKACLREGNNYLGICMN